MGHSHALIACPLLRLCDDVAASETAADPVVLCQIVEKCANGLVQARNLYFLSTVCLGVYLREKQEGPPPHPSALDPRVRNAVFG